MIAQELYVGIVPKGKARPRFARGGHPYTDPDQSRHEQAIRRAWMDRHGMEPVGGPHSPVSVTIDFAKPLPKSVKVPRPWTLKPDLDNLAKSVLDALNGVAYVDDAQIVKLTVRKLSQTREVPAGIRVTVIHFSDGEEVE